MAQQAPSSGPVFQKRPTDPIDRARLPKSGRQDPASRPVDWQPTTTISARRITQWRSLSLSPSISTAAAFLHHNGQRRNATKLKVPAKLAYERPRRISNHSIEWWPSNPALGRRLVGHEKRTNDEGWKCHPVSALKHRNRDRNPLHDAARHKLPTTKPS